LPFPIFDEIDGFLILIRNLSFACLLNAQTIAKFLHTKIHRLNERFCLDVHSDPLMSFIQEEYY